MARFPSRWCRPQPRAVTVRRTTRGTKALRPSSSPGTTQTRDGGWWTGPGDAGEPWAFVAGLAAAAALALAPAPPALAADAAKVGACLFGNCQKELARCVADEKCVESLVCLNTCTGKPDEADCQVRCGDLYADKAVMAFNACAVTEKKCVPQKQDDATFPALDKARTVPELPTSRLEGRWYIVAGLNRLFDTFDCQVHYFSAPKDDELYGKINWRVRRPNGDFYERSDVQTFVADPEAPGVLLNHDNEFLHYQDDWYVIESNDDFFVVYYRGQNDAWVGYGGAVVYAREPKLNPAWVPRLREVIDTKLANIDGSTRSIRWDDFKVTDNACKPRPSIPNIVPPRDLDTLGADVIAIEKDIQGGAAVLERGLEGRAVEVVREVEELERGLVSFGSRFTVINRGDGAPLGAPTGSANAKDKVDSRVKRSLDRVEARYASAIDGAEGGGFTWSTSFGPFLDIFRGGK